MSLIVLISMLFKLDEQTKIANLRLGFIYQKHECLSICFFRFGAQASTVWLICRIQLYAEDCHEANLLLLLPHWLWFLWIQLHVWELLCNIGITSAFDAQELISNFFPVDNLFDTTIYIDLFREYMDLFRDNSENRIVLWFTKDEKC